MLRSVKHSVIEASNGLRVQVCCKRKMREVCGTQAVTREIAASSIWSCVHFIFPSLGDVIRARKGGDPFSIVLFWVNQSSLTS